MPEQKTLVMGDFHNDVVRLRQLLVMDGLSDGQFRLDDLSDITKIGNRVFDKDVLIDVKDFQARHVGKDGFFLDVDGVVGTNTWWALENQKSSSQRSFIDLIMPDRLPTYRDDLLEIAIKEYMKNVAEIPEGSNSGGRIDIYTRNNPNPWCAFFVSWVIDTFRNNNLHIQVVNVAERLPEGSTYRMFKFTRANGSFYSKADVVDGSRRVIPGDLFMMQYRDDKGNLLGRGHVGLVLNVEKINDKWIFNTLEGNAGNRLKLGYREFKKKDSIEGFINIFGDHNKPRINNFVSKVRNVGSGVMDGSTR